MDLLVWLSLRVVQTAGLIGNTVLGEGVCMKGVCPFGLGPNGASVGVFCDCSWPDTVALLLST